MTSQERLIMFYGTECPHCHEMDAVIDRLEKEIGKKVERLEIWHDEENAQFMERCDSGFCGGVPFFYNEGSGEKICGAVPYDRLKQWATGTKT